MNDSERKNVVTSREPALLEDSDRREPLQPRDGRVKWSGRPTLAAFWPFYFTGALALLLAIAVEAVLPLPLLAWGAIVPFAALMALLPLLFQRAWKFTVTDREAKSTFEFWVRRVEEAPLERVTNVVGEQGAIGRLLGFGAVRVDTAGTPFPGVSFWGIREPFEVAENIREARNSVATPVKMEKK